MMRKNISFKELFENQKETNLSKDGKCNACNECCTVFLPLSKREFQELKKHFKNDYNLRFRRLFNSEDRAIDLMCPFSNSETKMCRVYEHRPNICKTYHCNKDFMSPPRLEKKEYMIYDLFASDVRRFLNSVREYQQEIHMKKKGITGEQINLVNKVLFNK